MLPDFLHRVPPSRSVTISLPFSFRPAVKARQLVDYFAGSHTLRVCAMTCDCLMTLLTCRKDEAVERKTCA
ncbi:hypothetical protein PISMIDRAFT_675440 [Pisolithus microcarpus 441]|uniref:Uncharacterized protein n=1 Tax=Pisolithus microcarpus 441 TaxID=765257 RepID=A0A0C9ZLM8_9AGAM|nr:hypothetical protein PISMIDRAFT_675440 [Pisolithus microcarpus 441]